MAKNSKIQSLLNAYLERYGNIDLLLPDGVNVQIGITQDSKNGPVKEGNYCWVVAKRDDRSMMLDRYSMCVNYDDSFNRMVDNSDEGVIYVI